MNRAASSEDLDPLLRFCRNGMLFDVQDWVAQGKPIALPEGAHSKLAQRNPLRVSIDTGFHSLVQVLLQAGAPIQEGRYHALEHAVELRRPDLARLLFEHGADVNDVSMRLVIEMWAPEMTDLFIARGASLTKGLPVAWGLINKIRPALGLVKRFGAEQPDIMRQAELALRFHACEGNQKWVSLLLWAGADPLARGPERIDYVDESEAAEADEEDGYPNAVQLAIMYGRLEVLTQNKKLVPPQDPSRPDTLCLLEKACWSSNADVLELLLARGHSPKLLPDRGTGAIHSIFAWMSMGFSSPSALGGTDSCGIDNSRAKEHMKMLHIVVAHGAKWMPADNRRISDVRKHLLKLAPKYTLEFVWLMQRYAAARRRDVAELLRTPSIARWLGEERGTAASLLAKLPEQLDLAESPSQA